MRPTSSPGHLWRDHVPDHVAVGSATLAFALAIGLAACSLSLLLRLPGFASLGPGWQTLARAHAPLLLFFSALPALLGGFGTLIVPLQIGAGDTAFPVVALQALLLTMLGFAAAVAGLMTDHPVWYAVAAILTALGSVLGASNLVATILNERAARSDALPIFVWSALIAASFAICAAPVMAASIALSAWHGTGIGVAIGGILTPALVGLVLPGLGLIGDIVGGLAGRPLVGRRTLVLTMAILATVAVMAWAVALLHGARGGDFASMAAIASATSIATVCWVLTLARSGRWVALASTPGLHVVGFVGAMLAGTVAWLAGDRLHDAVSLASVFALFAGFYRWAGMLAERTVPEPIGRAQSWLLLGGVVALLLPVAELRILGAAMIALSVALFGVLLSTMLLRGKREAVFAAWDARRDRGAAGKGRRS